ncbi:MAG: hypothetical protein JNL04_20740 [Rhodospirillaceae bacterium]|nr:hypothetical protein [Rhodospirillaceae bacterium]
MNLTARRQAGRRAPHKVLPVRRRQAYAGGGRPHVAANDNPLPGRPRRLRAGWALPFAVVLVAVAALAFA